MPFSRAQTGQCIFCAFRQHARPLRRRTPAAPALFFSSAPRRWTSLWATSTGPRIRFEPGGGSGKRSEAVANRDWGNASTYRPTAFRANDPSSRPARQQPVTMPRFREILLNRLDFLVPELRESPVVAQDGRSEQDVSKAISTFRWYLRGLTGPAPPTNAPDDLAPALRDVFIERGEQALDSQLKYAFYSHVLGQNFSLTYIQNQKALADLRYPLEWYPRARQSQRTIHLHIGPTNSGKTYHALKRLEEAKSGLYAGPLRLLAHEVYTRMNAKGIPCALVTGEEIRIPDDLKSKDGHITSCTVEMCDITGEMEVAVIDEIQMLGNKDRGWAWTAALAGVNAKEVHLCGEERAMFLVRELAAAMGDKLIIHRYNRLTPLKCEPQSLKGDFKKLRKGDCVVTFSVVAIHALRAEIEKVTGKRAAVVYGSLPSETRAQQARLFNDPDNDYDFLVASDAIGMGLNLSIKRVIFETVQKHNGFKVAPLSISDIRQIAGRAGRYRTAQQDTRDGTGPSTKPDNGTDGTLDASKDGNALFPTPPEKSRTPTEKTNVGLVTTLEKEDHALVAKAMNSNPPVLKSSGVFPPAAIIHRFASYFPPGTPFSYIMIRLHEISQVSSRFFLCRLREQVEIADVIHSIEELSTDDRIILCSAPAHLRDRKMREVMKDLATCIAKQKGGSLLDIQSLNLDLLDKPIVGNRQSLKELELLHKGIILYLWLSFRFPGVFTTRPLANHTKGLVEEAIEKTLKMLSFDETKRKEARKVMRERSKWGEITKDLLESEDGAGARSSEISGLTETGLQATVGGLNDENGLEAGETAATEHALRYGNPLGQDPETPRDDEGEYPEEEFDEDENTESLAYTSDSVSTEDSNTSSSMSDSSSISETSNDIEPEHLSKGDDEITAEQPAAADSPPAEPHPAGTTIPLQSVQSTESTDPSTSDDLASLIIERQQRRGKGSTRL